MTTEQYADWLARSRRHVMGDAQAADLLHDALLIACDAGRLDLDDESNRRWLSGVLRNRGAMTKRSDFRRTAREHASAADPVASAATYALPLRLDDVPRSARHVLALALHGMDRTEIASALQISDAALRQRLVVLRRALGDVDTDALLERARIRQVERASSDARHLRNRLIAHARRSASVASHDPDGHGLGLGFPKKKEAAAHTSPVDGND